MASERSYKYIILGGGVRAGYAVAKFVKQGLKPGELAIISSKGVAPYERPTLNKVYLFPESHARLPGFHTCVGGGGSKQPPEWYPAWNRVDTFYAYSGGATEGEDIEIRSWGGVQLYDVDILYFAIKAKPGVAAVEVAGGYIGLEIAA